MFRVLWACVCVFFTCCFALLLVGAEQRAPAGADGVELVDEDDARRHAPGAVEELARCDSHCGCETGVDR